MRAGAEAGFVGATAIAMLLGWLITVSLHVRPANSTPTSVTELVGGLRPWIRPTGSVTARLKESVIRSTAEGRVPDGERR